MNYYQVGDVIRCTGTFTDASATNTDPDNVFFQFKPPSGSIVSYQYNVDAEVIKSATGVYYTDIVAALEGKYRYRYYSSGSGRASVEGYFVVHESDFN